MKIAILTDGIYPFVIGGMQKHSYYLARFLVLRGHEITLVHCVPYGTRIPSLEEVLEQMRLPVGSNIEIVGMVFPKNGTAPGHYLKESYLYSRNIFRKLNDRWNTFDFIYAKGFCAWYLLDQKSRGYNCAPVGIKFHGYEMFQPTTSFKSKLQHWLLRKPVIWNNRHADYVFSYGGKITNIIKSLGVDASKIKEIPTGIESNWLRSETLAATESERNFLFIGRYERRKGVQELNSILAALVPLEHFHFHFIGPIPPSKRIKSQKITYHGQKSDKEELQTIMDKCQILVTPSHSEGMPNVILEGMSRGLAVIATDVGAVESMVDKGNGWLIPALDIEALRLSIVEAIRLSPAALVEKRTTSIQKVKEQFTWEDIALRTEEAILSCKIA